MKTSNYTLYQLIKYHIELSEALEYSLITYKYEEYELNERINYLKYEYKKGFFHFITKKLFNHTEYLTIELKSFLSSFKKANIELMNKDKDLHTRIKYNQNLYLAYSATKQLITILLEEEKIKNVIENELIELFNISNKHFNYFFLFNSLNLFVSSKVIILSGDSLYTLNDADKELLMILLTSLEDEINDKNLLTDTLKLIKGITKFKEDDAYELLNKISLSCIETEKNLYTQFEEFSTNLEKELEKNHN